MSLDDGAEKRGELRKACVFWAVAGEIDKLWNSLLCRFQSPARPAENLNHLPQVEAYRLGQAIVDVAVALGRRGNVNGDDDRLVALLRRDQRQREPRVARGRFDNRSAGFEFSFLLVRS